MTTPRSLYAVRLARDVEQLRAWGAEAACDVRVGEPSRSGEVEVRVNIVGPSDTPYDGGVYELVFTVGPDFPIKSPSVGFVTPIWHPNIDLRSGSVCLDVLTAKRWLPVITLRSIAELYIPQLLRYPEPSDPLNLAAANMMNGDAAHFADYTRLHCRKHARGEKGLALPSVARFERGGL